MPNQTGGPRVEREKVTAHELAELGIDIRRDFPGATEAGFRRYPALSEGGWYTMVKHQPWLRSVARVPAALLGPVTLASAGLEVG